MTVISCSVSRSESRKLEKQKIPMTELQRKALRERVAFLTSVKFGIPFVPLAEPDNLTELRK